jgi:hypothetical protein
VNNKTVSIINLEVSYRIVSYRFVLYRNVVAQLICFCVLVVIRILNFDFGPQCIALPCCVPSSSSSSPPPPPPLFVCSVLQHNKIGHQGIYYLSECLTTNQALTDVNLHVCVVLLIT